MASVELGRADIALASDPNSRVVIPALRTFTRRRTYDQALPHFLGDTDPTLYEGEQRGHSVPLVATYSEATHGEMWDLVALLDLPGVKLLRTHAFRAPGLDEKSYVAISEVQEAPDGAGNSKAWTVSFTATRVAYSESVV